MIVNSAVPSVDWPKVTMKTLAFDFAKFFILAFACLAPLCCHAQNNLPKNTLPATQTLSPRQIISKHLMALGGREKLSSKKNMTSIGKLEMSGPFGKFQLDVVTVIEGNKRVVEMSQGQLVIREGTDGTTFWKLNPQIGAQILKGDEKELMKMQSRLFPALTWDRFQGQIKVDGIKKIGVESCYEVTFRPTAGINVKRYFNAKTGRIERMVGLLSAAHGGEITVTPSDYRLVDGILIPFKQTTTGLDKNSKQPFEAVLTLEQVQFNLRLGDKIFELPDEVVKKASQK